MTDVQREWVGGQLSDAWKAYDADRPEEAVAICGEVLSDSSASPRTRVLAAAMRGWALHVQGDYSGMLRSGTTARETLTSVTGDHRVSLVAVVAEVLGSGYYLLDRYEESFDVWVWGLTHAAHSKAAERFPHMIVKCAAQAGLRDRVPMVFEPLLCARPGLSYASRLRYLLGDCYEALRVPLAAWDAFATMKPTPGSALGSPEIVAKRIERLAARLGEAAASDTVRACLECWKRGNLWATRRVTAPEARDTVAPVKSGAIELAIRKVGDLVKGGRLKGYRMSKAGRAGSGTVVPVWLEVAEAGGVRTAFAVTFALERRSGTWWITKVSEGARQSGALPGDATTALTMCDARQTVKEYLRAWQRGEHEAMFSVLSEGTQPSASSRARPPGADPGKRCEEPTPAGGGLVAFVLGWAAREGENATRVAVGLELKPEGLSDTMSVKRAVRLRPEAPGWRVDGIEDVGPDEVLVLDGGARFVAGVRLQPDLGEWGLEQERTRDGQLRSAASKLRDARAVAQLDAGTALRLRRDALRLCDEALVPFEHDVAGPVVGGLGVAGLLVKAATYESLGQVSRAEAFRNAALQGGVEPSALAHGVCRTVAIMRQSAQDAYVRTLEAIVDKCAGTGEEHGVAAWRNAVLSLPGAYRALEPSAPELAVAFCWRMLAQHSDQLNYPAGDLREPDACRRVLERIIRDWTGKALYPPPDVRVLGFLRLWQKGYYEDMYAYLAAPRTGGTGDLEFVHAASRLAEEGVRPADVGPIESMSTEGDKSTVRIRVRFERDRAPTLVSGTACFELVKVKDEDGQAVWLIDRGPKPLAQGAGAASPCCSDGRAPLRSSCGCGTRSERSPEGSDPPPTCGCGG